MAYAFNKEEALHQKQLMISLALLICHAIFFITNHTDDFSDLEKNVALSKPGCGLEQRTIIRYRVSSSHTPYQCATCPIISRKIHLKKESSTQVKTAIRNSETNTPLPPLKESPSECQMQYLHNMVLFTAIYSENVNTAEHRMSQNQAYAREIDYPHKICGKL
ncbi:hypothetical protein DICVIV_12350 [Dictyocaulus viviparus]|uniref:Uncharacterized protein n=1 Tax=Dictyocaulus viviparus TaxID=29172 RepID=A0A0D8XD07_DICVI|nr:hypothetical protein DICVIV_12350 [Dictyocaulus viviparus]